MKKYIQMITTVLLICMMAVGCTKKNESEDAKNTFQGELLSNTVETDLQEVIEGKVMADAIRYTVESRTYIVDDEETIRELTEILNVERVRAVDQELLAPTEECITFCGVLKDSNMGSYNFYLKIRDDFYFDGNTYYEFENIESLRACLENLKNSKKTTMYTESIDEDMNPLIGYWLGENMEIGIFQAGDGCYYFNISHSSNDLYSDGRIMICSIEKDGGNYVVNGLNEMARDCRYTVTLKGSGLELDGMFFEKAMME